jgi:hypothetical protein
MLVAEHGRVPYRPAGWQIAVVVLRYFAAVLITGIDLQSDVAQRGHSNVAEGVCL